MGKNTQTDLWEPFSFSRPITERNCRAQGCACIGEAWMPVADVTDACGNVVARYAYKPYGRLNKDLIQGMDA